MRVFFIATKERSLALQRPHHYLDLPTGKILLAVDEHDHLEPWKDHPDVTALPHPIFEATVQLKDEHLQHTSHLKVKKGHTVLDLIKEAGKRHPAMRLHVL